MSSHYDHIPSAFRDVLFTIFVHAKVGNHQRAPFGLSIDLARMADGLGLTLPRLVRYILKLETLGLIRVVEVHGRRMACEVFP